MADVAVEGTTEGVWHNLFLEVDKVASYRHPLMSYQADLDPRPLLQHTVLHRSIFNHLYWTLHCTTWDKHIKEKDRLHSASTAHFSSLFMLGLIVPFMQMWQPAVSTRHSMYVLACAMSCHLNLIPAAHAASCISDPDCICMCNIMHSPPGWHLHFLCRSTPA